MAVHTDYQAVGCGGCGRSNPADAGFCNGCGQALEQVSDIREERRQVTVLFSNVSGYTTMAQELDPELLRELMNTVYGRAGAIVDRYGGRIDKLMGDAVLAVFGDPVAHEDDAERAVRAAMELHAAVAELGPAFDAHTGRGIEMHSGINSGIVVASDHVRDRESGPLGDMVNVAARLQLAATAGQIVVGAETIALLGDAFCLKELGELELKGRRGSVRAAVIEGVSSPSRGPSRRASAFVGRHEELGVLLDGIDKVRDGESMVVTICAEAGAGKSRLLEEFRSRLDDDIVWVEGKAFAYTTNIPYAPIIDLISNVAGIDEGDSASAVSDKLEHLVERVAPGDEAAARVIRPLYGVSEQRDIDLEVFRSELGGVLARLIDVTAKRSPTVVCFQDLHWVDPSTTALIRDRLSRGGSLASPCATSVPASSSTSRGRVTSSCRICRHARRANSWRRCSRVGTRRRSSSISSSNGPMGIPPSPKRSSTV